MSSTTSKKIKKFNEDGNKLQQQAAPSSDFNLEFKTLLITQKESLNATVCASRRTLEDIRRLMEVRQNTSKVIGELSLFIERLNIGMEEENKTQIKNPSQLSQKTFKLLRLKEAIEGKTELYNDLVSNKDPTVTKKMTEIIDRWSKVCEPLLQEYLSLRTASTEYGQFKTLAAQESDWLERLEKKVVKSSSQAAADAEEISEELDDLENFLNNHSDERTSKIKELAKSISDKGILTDSTSFVIGGSGGGSFANSDKNRANVVDDANKLECKWVNLEKQARERIAILERSIAEAQEWEYKLISVQDWLQGKFHHDIQL